MPVANRRQLSAGIEIFMMKPLKDPLERGSIVIVEWPSVALKLLLCAEFIGNSAAIGRAIRPVVLRPRLSVGLPLSEWSRLCSIAIRRSIAEVEFYGDAS